MSTIRAHITDFEYTAKHIADLQVDFPVHDRMLASTIRAHITDFEYTAKHIADLQVGFPVHARMLAMLCLAGYRVLCGPETAGGNRWWAAYDPKGQHVSAVGGLTLTTVVNRLYTEAMRRGDIA